VKISGVKAKANAAMWLVTFKVLKKRDSLKHRSITRNINKKNIDENEEHRIIG
jgi:hypothetical protein